MTEHGPYWALKKPDGTLVANEEGTPFITKKPGMHFEANATSYRHTTLRVMLVELPADTEGGKP